MRKMRTDASPRRGEARPVLRSLGAGGRGAYTKMLRNKAPSLTLPLWGRGLFLLLALAACTVGEDYKQRPLTLPEMWQAISRAADGNKVTPAEPEEAAADREWWKRFDDETLNALVAQAEAGNHDRKIALARVREARAARIVTSAAGMPTVDAAGNAQRGNDGNIFNNKALTLYEAKFDASWELDIFGGVQRQAEAAEAHIAAQEAAERGVLISLRAEVVRAYVELRAAQRQLEIAQQSAQAQRETHSLAQSLYKAGLASEADPARADAQYHSLLAEIPTLETKQTLAKNQLAVLLGVQPQALPEALDGPAPMPVAQRAAVVDTPANVISARPDVAQAERQLAAATALSGAALAQLYPRLSLAAVFGVRDSSFAGSGTAWSVGAGALQPVFNSGRLRAGVEQADARQEQAAAAYEKAVLAAQTGVENALTAYLNEDARRGSLREAQASAERGVELAQERYRKGISAFVDVLLAQRAQYAAESELTQSEAEVAKNLAGLYKQLGM